jgi:hypothetical protein
MIKCVPFKRCQAHVLVPVIRTIVEVVQIVRETCSTPYGRVTVPYSSRPNYLVLWCTLLWHAAFNSGMRVAAASKYDWKGHLHSTGLGASVSTPLQTAHSYVPAFT